MPGELEFRNLRILIAGGRAPQARILRTALSLAGITQVAIAPGATAALRMLKEQPFAAMLVDETIGDVGTLPFIVAARIEDNVIDPLIPIFLVCGALRLRELKRARDSGVTDILACPISAATLKRRLSAALLKPRPFIKSESFFGPDRRGEGRPPHCGEDRRERNARKVRLAKPAWDSTQEFLQPLPAPRS